MNIDTLKTAWHSDTSAQPDAGEIERLTRESCERTRRYERGARLRLIYGSTVFALTLVTMLVLTMLPHIWQGMRFALLLWSASMLACAVGLWRIRADTHIRVDIPLATCLRRSLQRIRREIAYQRSLRWWFWVPFGIGFAAALFWNPPTPPGSHPFLLLGTAVLWAWGMINGPRIWPQQLQAQADDLQALLDQSDTTTNSADGDVA